MWGPTNPLYTLTATVNLHIFPWLCVTTAFYFICTKWKSQFLYEWPHPFPPSHVHLSLPFHEQHHPSLHRCDWSHAPFPTTLAPMLSLPWSQFTPHCYCSDLGSEFRERMLLACWPHCRCCVFIQPSTSTIISSVNPYLSMNYTVCYCQCLVFSISWSFCVAFLLTYLFIFYSLFCFVSAIYNTANLKWYFPMLPK